MKKIKLFWMLVIGVFFFGCDSSSVQTLDDIPASYINGTKDIEKNRLNSLIRAYDENTTAIAEKEYPYPTLYAVNSVEELALVKEFFVLDTLLDDVDLSKETILIAFRLIYGSVDADITIKEIKYDEKNHVHAKVYLYTKSLSSLSSADIRAMYHAFTIPKTKTQDISYEVIRLGDY